MKKFLVSTILGISVTGAATASIVSRGFFEEAMENYATNTALDLKANQSDLTALSNIVGTNNWDKNNKGLFFMSFPFYQELGYDTEATNATWVDTGNITSMFSLYNTNPNVPGFAGVTDKLLNGWTNDRGTTYQGIKALNDGWTDREGYIMNPGIKAMFNGWTGGDYHYSGLYHLSGDDLRFRSTFGEPVGSILSYGLEKFTSKEYTGPIYPLWKLSQGIGTLPTGNLPPSPIYELVFPLNALPTTYPTSLSDLITVLFGDEKTYPGIINLFAVGFNTNGTLPYPVAGIIPAMDAATSAQLAANSANDKIGDLPSGAFPGFPEYNSLFPWVNQPYSYPTSLAELITAIYGNSKTGYAGLLGAIIAGFPPFDADGNDSPDARIGLIPNRNLARNAKDLADANAAKIGTLPTEYETVGAALSAIKGIAEEAKQKAEAAIPDPKAEGATGKYVLTVDIADSTAIPVYRWEKIDRTLDETQSEQ